MFAAGLLIRLLALPLDGTEDVFVWKTWSYAALDQGLSRMYGVGGRPPERGVVRWGERATTVDYPPVALYELAAAGAIYRTIFPSFPNTRSLNVAMKLPGLLAEAALAFLLLRVIARRYGSAAGRWAAAACWMNPSMILAGSALGYLDPLMALPALGAIVAATCGAPALAGGLLAIACLTKVQAVFVAPVVALAVWAGRPARRARDAAMAMAMAMAGGSAVTGLVVLPYVLAGAWRNLLQGIGSLLRHDMLSADAANLWWIVSYVMRAVYAVAELGAWASWTMVVRILGISTIVRLGYPNPRALASAMVVAAAVWALWRARRSAELSIALACGAFIVHAYFVLAVQVHENHLYLAVPLLAGAAGAVPSLRPVFFALSAVFALNLYLFFGLGRGFPPPARTLTIVDTTVLLAIANCALLAWHARRFTRAAAQRSTAS